MIVAMPSPSDPTRRDPRPNPRPKPRSPASFALPPRDPRSFTVPAPNDAGPAPDDTVFAPGALFDTPTAPPEAPELLPELEPAPPRRKRWWLRIVGVVVVVALVLAGFAGYYAWHTYRKLDRVAVGQVLTPEGGAGTNYLIVGTDSRAGLDDSINNADLVVGDGVQGSRSDTIVVMRVSSAGNLMLPIPRDLYVPIAGTKGKNRINTAIEGGPERLIQTVQQSLGVPIHHYVEIDFVGFLDLVDAVGGITIDFDAPASDPKSGLDIKQAGPQKLDKDMALAYVRSRTYTRIINGKPVVDPRGDLGRIERQQIFLHAVMSQVGNARNPVTVAHIGDAIASNLKVDDKIGFFDAVGLARKLAGLNPETVDLPTKPTRTSAGAAVLLPKEPGAGQAFARFK
jgi:LCP family protein required for cell wall assembly